jgi:hypothetical protein
MLCGLAIVWANVAIAQNVFGAGTITCGDWLEYRDQNLKDHEYQAQAWIDGFVSGSNVSRSNGPDILASRTGDDIYTWIDSYCRAKPRDRLVAATWALVKELQSKAK